MTNKQAILNHRDLFLPLCLVEILRFILASPSTVIWACTAVEVSADSSCGTTSVLNTGDLPGEIFILQDSFEVGIFAVVRNELKPPIFKSVKVLLIIEFSWGLDFSNRHGFKGDWELWGCSDGFS